MVGGEFSLICGSSNYEIGSKQGLKDALDRIGLSNSGKPISYANGDYSVIRGILEGYLTWKWNSFGRESIDDGFYLYSKTKEGVLAREINVRLGDVFHIGEYLSDFDFPKEKSLFNWFGSKGGFGYQLSDELTKICVLDKKYSISDLESMSKLDRKEFLFSLKTENDRIENQNNRRLGESSLSAIFGSSRINRPRRRRLSFPN